jgi:hypothetical protein
MPTTPPPVSTNGGPAVLDRAEQLLAEGALLDAIEAFTAAHRLDPTPELAHRIVLLRHRAASEVDGGPGRDSWPPVLADPFPDVVGLPEIGTDQLTSEVLGGSILHHGGVIVRGFLDSERAQALLSTVVAALEDRDTLEDPEQPGVGGGRYRPFDAVAPSVPTERAWVREVGGMLMADAPEIMVELLDVFGRSGAAEAITGYLGERPALSYNKCVLRRLIESAPTWHQDGAFMGSDIRSVDVWLSLSDCGGDAPAPGLDLVPKRFHEILETGTKGSIFPNSIGQGLIDEVATDAPPETPRFAPGDAVVFDERFVHRSSAGRTFTKERYAVESWFFAPSRFPERYVPILV